MPSPKDKRRVSALEQLQADRVRLEVEFHNEVALLEQKYNNLYKPLFEKVQEGVRDCRKERGECRERRGKERESRG